MGFFANLADSIFPWRARAAGRMAGISEIQRSSTFATQELIRDHLRHFLSATESRNRPDWYTPSFSGDLELIGQLPVIRARSRLMVDNDPKASGLIRKDVVNSIGPGCTAQAWMPKRARKTLAVTDDDAKTLAFEAETWWKETVDLPDNLDFDWRRMRTFLQYISLMFRTLKTDGDLYVRFYAKPGRPLPFCTQIVEADCIGTPEAFSADPSVRAGHRFSPDGELLGFYVARRHPGDVGAAAGHDYVPAVNEFGLPGMIHLFDPGRETRTRGLPWLATSLVPLNDLADYKNAELQRKRIEADIALLIGLDNPKGFAGALQADGGFGAAPSAGRDANRSSEARAWETRGRKVAYLNKGETVSVVDPQRPGNTYEPFCNSIDRDIGSGIGRSFERVSNNYGAANFSATRVSGIEDYVEHETEFEIFAGAVLCPIWQWAMWAMAMETGDLRYRAVKARFQRYVKPSWDPATDADAAQTRLDSGATSLVEECGMRGDDWEAVQDHALQVEAREKAERERLGLPEKAPKAAPAPLTMKVKAPAGASA